MRSSDVISIGALAHRTGVSVSAIRFYEAKGLLQPFRSAGGQRRFLRSDIRRLSFVRIAQQLGLSIELIEHELTKRARQSSNLTAQIDKTRARNCRSAFKIKAKRWTKIKMFARDEIKVTQCTG